MKRLLVAAVLTAGVLQLASSHPALKQRVISTAERLAADVGIGKSDDAPTRRDARTRHHRPAPKKSPAPKVVASYGPFDGVANWLDAHDPTRSHAAADRRLATGQRAH